MSASLARQRHLPLGYLRPQVATSDEMRRLTAGYIGTVEEQPTEAL